MLVFILGDEIDSGDAVRIDWVLFCSCACACVGRLIIPHQVQTNRRCFSILERRERIKKVDEVSSVAIWQNYVRIGILLVIRLACCDWWDGREYIAVHEGDKPELPVGSLVEAMELSNQLAKTCSNRNVRLPSKLIR